MKSAHKPTTRREALTKYVRAKAHREGTLFKTALGSVIDNENGTGAFIPVLTGKDTGYSPRWETRERLRVERSVKSPARDPAARPLAVDKEEDTFSEVSSSPHQTVISVPILKIAKLGKRKGVAKDFEVISKVRNVVALPEERAQHLPGDDDWERICDEEEFDARPSYSAILRRNER